jgi:hypothetical protein
MNDLRSDGLIEQIYFVTWKNRMEDKPELHDYLLKHDISVVLAEESPVGGKGNFWHQTKSLDIGLRQVPDGHHVLRTRTDLHIEKDFLKSLFSGSVKSVHTTAESPVFENRIWVPCAVIDKPFYICDYCFYGNKIDMERLYNYDAKNEVLYDIKVGNAEHWRFIHPYLQEFPFLEQYITDYANRPNEYTNRHQFLETRLSSEVFSKFLSFYWKVLMSDFYIYIEPINFRTTGERSLNEIDFKSNFMEGPESSKYHIKCSDSAWLEAHLGKNPSEGVPPHILENIDEEFSYWRNYEIDEDLIKREVAEEKNMSLDHPVLENSRE